ncbi:unnamed protein product [Zymoseptoria tritici ST99CH_3D1]|nr:unnamed protein product [Zymoseptoria tritici ST99CH_3D1]
MKSSSLLLLLAALSDAAPQDLHSALSPRQAALRTSRYFPKPFPPPTNQPAPSPFTIQSGEPVYPQLKATPQLLGLVSDPTFSRDSCGTTRLNNRTLWACRDSQYVVNGAVNTNSLLSSTASWSNSSAAGQPTLLSLKSTDDKLNTTVLKQYGTNSNSQAFYPVNPNKFCSSQGGCSDGSRYAIWPDSPPMRTSYRIGYTWIRATHINQDLGLVEPNPATILYKVTAPSATSGNTLPSVTVVNETFWGRNEIAYGAYGNVVRNGIAYLYGQANGTVSLAKVPVGSVENRSAYRYWVNGDWVTTAPKIGADGIRIENVSVGGQGTYFWSQGWNSYVWIGGNQHPGATMYITTAPDPAGPWITPIRFYDGPNGNFSLPAYSIQAHPAMMEFNPSLKSMLLTYTKVDQDSRGNAVYSHPLIYAQWN